MTAEGTRCARNGKRAILGLIASVLLASCATSETQPFGFAIPASTASRSSDFSHPTVNSAADQDGAVGEFVMDENDPELPEQVADLPSMRPDSEAAILALQQAEPDPASQTLQAQAAVIDAQGQDQAQVAALPDAAPPAEQATPAAAAEQASAEPRQFLENAPVQQSLTAAPPKRGFLSALFGNQPARAAVMQQPARALIPDAKPAAQPPAQPIVQLASASPAAARPLVATAASPLPGVRDGNSLFEISRRSGMDDDSDIDLYEDSEPYQVASAAGLARLAPNGLMKQTEHVDVACLKPSLVRVLKAIENHYGRKVVVTSGYRNPDRNRRARGARNSLHMYCAAADVQVEGVTKWQLAEFARTMPGRGGVGTYCHTDSVHIDVGPERDWNWRCRRRK